MNRRVLVALGVVVALFVIGCPAGRGNKELGEECFSNNDCPMGTTGLVCASGCVGPSCKEKSFCTKKCGADTDCAGSKGGAMVCTNGNCAFKK